ncbi:MAG: divergent polysaccharide deacetylase family protein [Syntrophobacteraceae bacterium]
MASGGKPDGKKPSAKRAGSRGDGRKSPSGKGGRKPGAKRGAGKAPAARRKFPRFALLAAWIFALTVLVATIYWSGSGRDLRPESRDSAQTLGPSKAEAPGREPSSGALTTGPEQTNRPLGKPAAPKDPKNSGQASLPAASEAPKDLGQAALPAGPSLPPKPAFSSKDLPPDPLPAKDQLALVRPSPGVSALKPPTVPVPARVAIVIDDFGRDLESAKKFLSLPFPVTFSVLPFQAHSAEIARLAHSEGREVILHLPMEPQGYPRPDPGRGALLLSMSGDAIRSAMGSALDVSPYFRGVNNHMGSKMTENPKAMKTVLEELNRRGLFFLDSCTSSKSRAWVVAREMKMPGRRRDIFLDHNPSADSVRAQISKLIRKARAEGTALAIGHPHQATLKALREASGEFGKHGVKIVPASELMSGIDPR